MVRRSASSRPAIGGLQKLLSQLSGMFMAAASCELLEEAQVAVEEEAQVVDAIAEHRQALEAGTESEADVALGIEPEVLHHRGVHLAGAGDLQPFAFQLHVDFGGWLGERKERRAEAHLEIFDLEEAPQEFGVDALEVGEADFLVDPQALDLV